MKQIREIYKKTGKLHHAYGLWGEREEIKKELHDFLIEDLKFPVVGNPDFWQGEFNVFKVDDSRVLNESHLNKPVKYERKFFVILANFMTKDAQNSLLKIFEEPKADTIFFLIMPSVTDLIPTLKSRLIIGSQGQNTNIPEHNRPIHPLYLAEEFLSAKIGKRLTMIAKIVKDIKDEKLNKSDAISFIKKMEKIIKNSLKAKNAHNARNGSLLAVEDLERAISYANDESPSIKIILEHLALVL